MSEFHFTDPFSFEILKHREVRHPNFPILVPPYRLLRFTHKGNRFYSKILGPTEIGPATKSSTTSAQFLPEKWDWKTAYYESWGGKHRAEANTRERAFLGEFMHILFAQYLIDLMTKPQSPIHFYEEDVEKAFISYAHFKGKPSWMASENLEELCNKLIGFEQWCRDHKVRPILIEQSLADDEDSCTLDLYCLMEVNELGYWGEVYKTGKKAGEPRRTRKTFEVFAIVDFKSGETRTDKHTFQLHVNKKIFHNNFDPEQWPVDRLYNLMPKSPRKGTKDPEYYTMVDQTNKMSERKVNAVLELASIELEGVMEKPWKTCLTGAWGPKEDKLEEEIPSTKIMTVYDKVMALLRERETAATQDPGQLMTQMEVEINTENLLSFLETE